MQETIFDDATHLNEMKLLSRRVMIAVIVGAGILFMLLSLLMYDGSNLFSDFSQWALPLAESFAQKLNMKPFNPQSALREITQIINFIVWIALIAGLFLLLKPFLRHIDWLQKRLSDNEVEIETLKNSLVSEKDSLVKANTEIHDLKVRKRSYKDSAVKVVGRQQMEIERLKDDVERTKNIDKFLSHDLKRIIDEGFVMAERICEIVALSDDQDLGHLVRQIKTKFEMMQTQTELIPRSSVFMVSALRRITGQWYAEEREWDFSQEVLHTLGDFFQTHLPEELCTREEKSEQVILKSPSLIANVNTGCIRKESFRFLRAALEEMLLNAKRSADNAGGMIGVLFEFNNEENILRTFNRSGVLPQYVRELGVRGEHSPGTGYGTFKLQTIADAYGGTLEIIPFDIRQRQITIRIGDTFSRTLVVSYEGPNLDITENHDDMTARWQLSLEEDELGYFKFIRRNPAEIFQVIDSINPIISLPVKIKSSEVRSIELILNMHTLHIDIRYNIKQIESLVGKPIEIFVGDKKVIAATSMQQLEQFDYVDGNVTQVIRGGLTPENTLVIDIPQPKGVSVELKTKTLNSIYRESEEYSEKL